MLGRWVAVGELLVCDVRPGVADGEDADQEARGRDQRRADQTIVRGA